MRKIIVDDAEIEFRETPWDARSLGLNTIEVTNIRINSDFDFFSIYDHFYSYCSQNAIEFVCLRLNANDKALRKLLLRKGFYVAEVSYVLKKSNLATYSNRLPEVKLINVRSSPNLPFLIQEIAELARDSFDFSRFHDDVNIPDILARRRYFNWIFDLLDQDNEFFYVEHRGEVVGFHVQKVTDDGELQLIITGAKKGRNELAIPLWHTVLTNAKRRGITSVKTLISSTNIGVVNLYSFLGFKFTESLVGLHKFINRNNFD